MNTQIITVIALAITAATATAADINECNMKKTQNDKWECMASYSGSAAFCDRITAWERRQHCVRMVIRKQREHR